MYCGNDTKLRNHRIVRNNAEPPEPAVNLAVWNFLCTVFVMLCVEQVIVHVEFLYARRFYRSSRYTLSFRDARTIQNDFKVASRTYATCLMIVLPLTRTVRPDWKPFHGPYATLCLLTVFLLAHSIRDDLKQSDIHVGLHCNDGKLFGECHAWYLCDRYVYGVPKAREPAWKTQKWRYVWRFTKPSRW